MPSERKMQVQDNKPSGEKREKSNFICLGIVVNSKGEVLMIKRKKEELSEDKKTKITWAFPGGKIILGEERPQCVEREVLAETGYKTKCTREIKLKRHPQFPVIICYYRCTLVEELPIAEPREPWEIEEIRWVNPKEIKILITTSLDLEVAKELGIN